MLKNIMLAFKSLLKGADWIDDKTKVMNTMISSYISIHFPTMLAITLKNKFN